MTIRRNLIVLGICLLAWASIYTLYPYMSAQDSRHGEIMSNDVLFVWVPSLLALLAYVAHAGRWFVRLALSVIPPVLLLSAVFVSGIAGVITTESAWGGVLLLMFALRAFVIALAVSVVIVEAFERYRSTKQSPLKSSK